MINNILENTISDMAICGLADDIRSAALRNLDDGIDSNTKSRITAQILVGSMTNTGNHVERMAISPFLVLSDSVKSNLRDAYKQRKSDIQLSLSNTSIDNRLLSRNIFEQKKLHAPLFKANSDLILMRAVVTNMTRRNLKSLIESSEDDGKSIKKLKVPEALKEKISNLSGLIKNLPLEQAASVGGGVTDFWQKLLDIESKGEKDLLGIKIDELNKDVLKKIVNDTRSATLETSKEIALSSDTFKISDKPTSRSERYENNTNDFKGYTTDSINKEPKNESNADINRP